MRPYRAGEIFAALALAAALGACTGVSNFAGNLGEPTDTPGRPTTAYQYPAVHDMPPARADKPLTDEQQVEMERSLELVRDRQEGRKPASPDETAKKAAQNDKNRTKMPIQIVPAGTTPIP